MNYKIETKSSAHPLQQRLVDTGAGTWVDEGNIDAFMNEHAAEQVLFLMGDNVRFPEGLDVAVVLPELQKHLAKHAEKPFRLGVVRTEAEGKIAERFASRSWPNLIFLRGKDYLGNISSMHDWDVYLQKCHDLLAASAKPKPIAIPVVATGGSTTGCQ